MTEKAAASYGGKNITFAIMLIVLDLAILVTVYYIPLTDIFLGLAAAMIAIALLTNRRGFLYFLIIAFSIWGILRSPYLSVRLGKYLAGMVMFLIFITRYYFVKQSLTMPEPKLLHPFLIFYAYIALSIILANDSWFSLLSVVRLGLYVLTFLLIYNLIESRSDLVSVSWVTIIVSLGVFSVALYESFVLGYARTWSTVGNANHLGFFTFLSISIMLMLFQIMESKFSKFLLLITVLLGLMTLYSSLSRTNLLSTAIFIAIFLWVNRYRKLFWLSTAIGFIGLIIIFSSRTIEIDIARLLRLGAGLSGRDILWIGGLKIVRNNFFTGVGFACAKTVLRSYITMSDPRVPMLLTNAIRGGNLHNGYLQVFAETGVIGFTILCYVNYKFYTYLLASYKTARDKITKYAVQWLLILYPAIAVIALFQKIVLYGPISDMLILVVFLATVVKLIDFDNGRVKNYSAWKNR